MRPLRILFAAAEVRPYSQVGGLGDVAAGLPKALTAWGHDVRVVTPAHASVLLFPDVKPLDVKPFTVRFLGKDEEVSLLISREPGREPIYFVRNETYFDRPGVYGAGDDMLRYWFFSRVVLELPKVIDWKPQIMHANDWQTAALTVGVHNRAPYEQLYRDMATVYTIHNLAYRGPDETIDQVVQALHYADVVTTVSPTHAQELMTPEYGNGLHAAIRRREHDLFGVLNGLDADVFDPLKDAYVSHPFDGTTLERRALNKRDLQETFGLAVQKDVPVIGMVTRVVEQKGFDLLLKGLDRLLDETRAQLVIVGPADEPYRTRLVEEAAKRPAQLAVHPEFSIPLGRKVYAGSDMFLMPSRYEPCGVGQLIAMWYGSVPIVRKTGGLADTVIDGDRSPATGNGFAFREYTPEAMLEAVRRAMRAYASKETWKELQLRGMREDFSWDASVAEYDSVYRLALERRGLPSGREAGAPEVGAALVETMGSVEMDVAAA